MTEGQSDEGTPLETTDTGTESSDTDSQTTDEGTVEEESFFDPQSIKGKPELEAAYKEMQRAFTKKTSSLKEQSKKVEAYDAFMQDPISQMQNIAKQYGYSLSRAQAQEMAQMNEPQSWDDVYSRAKQEVLKDLQPIINEVRQTKKTQMEHMLDESCPDWRTYEDDMMQTLQKHPTLVNDPVKLYQLSVPSEVFTARATQAALKKLQTKAEHAQVSGGSTTNKSGSNLPKGKLSFQDAVKAAKAKLSADGLTEPRS